VEIPKVELIALADAIKTRLKCACGFDPKRAQKEPCACRWTPIEDSFHDYGIDLREDG